MDTTVVNIKTGALYDVYIGRANIRLHLEETVWANPFKIGKHGTREEVLVKHETYLQARFRQNPALWDELEKLRGKRLGCYCKPLDCHGDLLVVLLDMSDETRQRWLDGEL